MNSYAIPESRYGADKLFVASLSAKDLLTDCYLVNLLARFSKVEH